MKMYAHNALCANHKVNLMKIALIIMLLTLTSCSEILMMSSLGGAVVSQSPAIKAYNGADALTIGRTKKSIKQHAYERLKGEDETKKSKPNE